jgi:hypothetical protein
LHQFEQIVIYLSTPNVRADEVSEE